MEKAVLIYDLSSMPRGVTMEQVVKVWKEHELIVYDSQLGSAPVVTSKEVKGVLVDMSNVEEEKLIEIQKLLK